MTSVLERISNDRLCPDKDFEDPFVQFPTCNGQLSLYFNFSVFDNLYECKFAIVASQTDSLLF